MDKNRGPYIRNPVCLTSRRQLACDILGGTNLGAVRLVAVPLEVVVADLDVVLLRDLLVLVEARLLEGVAALFVLGGLELRLVLLVARLRGDVIAPVSRVSKTQL